VAEPAENPFWRYSLACYARAGVAAACLSLQDRRGLDVNLLLCCCWAGNRGQALTAGRIEALVAATRDWQGEVVRPLRAVRRWLKGQDGASALREAIQAQELEAERLQQHLLWQKLSIPEGSPVPGLAAGNLRAYLAVMDLDPDAQDLTDLASLVTGCFPDLNQEQALSLLVPDAPVSL